MIRLRSYAGRVAAWNASGFLREHGILSKVFEVDPPFSMLLMSVGPPAAFWVVLAFEHDRDAAEAVLDTFDADAPRPDAGWEDDIEPDLRLLPAGLKVPCAGCHHNLRPGLAERLDNSGHVICDACGMENNAAERVVAMHGPEALEDCYDRQTDPEWIDAATLRRIRIPCPGCQYPLTGLAETGACPECGQRYDKVRIIEDTLESMRRLPPESRHG